MPIADVARRLEFAVAIAREAGDITLRHFGRHVAVEFKSDASPVTIADRESEQHLRKRIEAEFPADGILGEEFGERPGTSGLRWILDPIDGTKSFISGVPLYGTLVGLEHEGRGVIGVIHVPALNETVYAAKGHGAWHLVGARAAVAARVSTKASLDAGLFVTSEVKTFHRTRREAIYQKLQERTWLARSWGDCYGYLLVATGRAELMVDPQMSVWDAAALQPILEEAGGTFTDFQGVPTIYTGEGIATNGHVLAEVLAITSSP